MATTTAPSGFGRPIWSAVKHARGTHGVGLTPVSTIVKGHNATVSKSIFLSLPATEGFVRLRNASISLITAAIAGHADDYWTFGLQVGSDDMGPAVMSSQGGGMALDTAYQIPVTGPETATPKKVFLAGDDILKLTMTKFASGVDQSANYFRVDLWLLLSHP